MSPLAAGTTFGVEEEFHLVAADGYALRPLPEVSRRAEAAGSGGRLRPEMLTSQLEAVTGVCTDLVELRNELLAGRAAAADAAAAHGATILATSTHPFAALSEIDIAERPRYRELEDRFGVLPHLLNLTGCHVHIGVGVGDDIGVGDDTDTAIAIMNHARPYLPTLAALAASSPFHEGRDTGFQSFRLAQIALWPQGGPPPYFESAAHYRDVVASLVAIGLATDAGTVLWELRPSQRYPTLEFRIPDVCPDVEVTVLLAGLIRSLVRTLARRLESGVHALRVEDAVLRAARWRAARDGISGQLWSWQHRRLDPAATVINDLWRELEPDLNAHDEIALLRPILRRLLAEGTSADRQRSVFARTGSLQSVVQDGVTLTLRSVPVR